MNRKCAHAAEQVRLARTQVREGRYDEALGTYLAILARHPVGARCRGPIAQAAADLAFDLSCLALAQRLAGAAFDEFNRWPVPRRRRARAVLMMGRTSPSQDEARQILSGTDLPGGWPWLLRRQVRVARAELAAPTAGADTDGAPSPAAARRRYRRLIPRMRRRTRAVRQMRYAQALLAAERPEWAAAHSAAAADTLSRSRAVRRWVKRGLVPDRRRGQQVCLSWALAVTGELSGPDPAPHAALCPRAIDLLYRLGHGPAAARSAAQFGELSRAAQDEAMPAAVGQRSDSICWYLDEDLVQRWADAVTEIRKLVTEASPESDVADIGWLTGESGAQVLSTIETTYTALHDIDPENFEYTNLAAYKTLAIYIDRIGLPHLALEASEREVNLLRKLIDVHGDNAREELAWALRRHAFCLADADADAHDGTDADGRIAAAWTEAADLLFRFADAEAVAFAHQKLTDLHIAADDWQAAASAAMLGASRVAAMTGQPPLPAFDAALGELESRAFQRTLTTTGEELSSDRLELAALMAAWDPDTYTAPYIDRLIGRANRRDLDARESSAALDTAVAAARALAESQRSEHSELLTRTLSAAASFALDHDQPAAALAQIDAVLALHRAAIAADQLRHDDLAAALLRRDRCLEALGRREDRATTLADAYAAVSAERRLGRHPRTNLADIAERLWDIDEVDLAIDVLSDSLLWARLSDDDRARQHADRAYYFALLRRPEEALRDLEAAARLAGEAAWLASQRGLVLVLIGRPQEALEVFSALATSRPHDSYVRRMLGLIRLDAGEPEASVRDSLEAVRLRPASAVNREVLAYGYLATGEIDEALRHGHLAADLADDEAGGHYAYGVALRSYGDHADGDAELARAIALTVPGASPLAGDRYAYQAIYQAARGHRSEAVDQLRRGLRIGLTPFLLGHVHTQLAILAACLPDTTDACAAMRAALYYSPGL